MEHQQAHCVPNTLNSYYPNQNCQYPVYSHRQCYYQEQSWNQGWDGGYQQYPLTPVSMSVVSEPIGMTHISKSFDTSSLQSNEKKRPGRKTTLPEEERAGRRRATNCIHQRFKRYKEKSFARAAEEKDQARNFFLQQYFPMLDTLEQILLNTQMSLLAESGGKSSLLYKEEQLVRAQLFQEFVFQIRELKVMGRRMEQETRDADERMKVANEKNKEEKKREKEELIRFRAGSVNK